MGLYIKKVKDSLLRNVIGSVVDILLYETPISLIISKSGIKNGVFKKNTIEMLQGFYIELKFDEDQLMTAKFKTHSVSITGGGAYSHLLSKDDLNEFCGSVFTTKAGHKLELSPVDATSGWYFIDCEGLKEMVEKAIEISKL